ncbi:MAG: NAD(P)/FAD-dependent oxidoreductase [Myxococcales bacterium]|nr:NAD(P)/FAD-dependent oxidoreductase [Myxococcales bacterium]USN51467.1 MAG: NAD(P)/FAD-dependent oxidoreductase [Myxococcales bacterium]
MENKYYDVVIIGGGSGGISVAARLLKAEPKLSVAIIEPSDKHYYQPLWTLVGAGAASLSDSLKKEEDLIPKRAVWIKDYACSFVPEKNKVIARERGAISYQYLVVCPGMQTDWDKISGLKETLGENSVCSNYSEKYVEKTWQFLQEFKAGKAIFTFPNTPIKCAGAPQKIMYLAEDYLSKKGIRDQSQIIFASAGDKIFGIEKYAKPLRKIIEDRKIQTRFRHNLVAVNGPKKIATFEELESGNKVEIAFDFLHVSPPMSAPDFIKTSPLADDHGWVNVDPKTLQHKKFSNIFGLGDASSLPTSKTGAAIRKQAPVLSAQLLAHRRKQKCDLIYNGYTSCPLVTGYGKLILAEFDYDKNPCETFPFDQSKERYSMYLLKKYLLPYFYWYGMLKGRA